MTRIGAQGPTISLGAGDAPKYVVENALRGVPEWHGGRSLPPNQDETAELINFSANDYLALANDPRLIAAAHEAALREGWGAGASPLVTGHSQSHRDLEERLAEFMGTEAALVFPSGFAANSGTIAALVGRGDVVIGDQKNHASHDRRMSLVAGGGSGLSAPRYDAARGIAARISRVSAAA